VAEGDKTFWGYELCQVEITNVSGTISALIIKVRYEIKFRPYHLYTSLWPMFGAEHELVLSLD
jgi:hypothetical protein